MERTSVRKLAWALWIVLTVLLVCNLIALFFVPGLTLLQGEENSLAELTAYENPLELPLRLLVFFAHCWSWVLWAFLENPYRTVLAGFLLFCGVCMAVMLWQGRQVLGAICRRASFGGENAARMRRAAVCAFLISAAALGRVCLGFWLYRDLRPLLTYNALFCALFLMAGLVFLVMSALFRQAAAMQEVQDLTI